MQVTLREINRKLDYLIEYVKKESEARWRLFEVLLEFVEEEEPEELEQKALEEVTGERISWKKAKKLIG
ncbi:MAG: hypothetical protein Q6363_006660 [Candidatus Njordarchaeota archaeon]